MKKLFLVAATCAVFFPCTTNAQNWQFLETAGATGDDGATSVAVEPSGSATYSVGTFTDSITFGQMTFAGTGTIDGYITKYSSNGTIVWAMHIRTTHEVVVTDIVYAAGSAYVAGHFSGSVYIANDSAISAGGTDIFMLKLNGSTGALVWLMRCGGLGDDRAETIALGTNMLCIGGSFEDVWVLGVDTLQSYGGSDVLIATFDFAGTPLWSHTGGGLSDDQATSIAVDIAGNCYAIGAFVGTVAFGQATLTSLGGNDVFVLNYGPTGAWGWIRSIYGTGEESVMDATADLSGHVYVVGTFSSLTLNFMSQTITNADSSSGFLAAYDANGYVSWVSTYPRFACQTVACTSTNVFVAGTFSDSCVFDSQIHMSAGVEDICIIKCTTSGVVLGVHQCGGVGNEKVSALIADQNGTVYLCGAFSDTQIYFQPYVAQNADATGQTTDAYVGKFPAALLGLSEPMEGVFSMYPNPFTDYCVVDVPNSEISEIVISDLLGREMKHIHVTGSIIIPLEDLPDGVYVFALYQNGACCSISRMIAQ